MSRRLHIVIPTIDGREAICHEVATAYHHTVQGVMPYTIGHPRNFRTWPAALNFTVQSHRWMHGSVPDDDLVHFGADDLMPYVAWLARGIEIIDGGGLPAFRFHQGSGDVVMGGDFTRIPLLSVGQLRTLGMPPSEIPYYADCWWSEVGSELGIPTVDAGPEPCFFHHVSSVGRIDPTEEQDAEARSIYAKAMRDFLAGPFDYLKRQEATDPLHGTWHNATDDVARAMRDVLYEPWLMVERGLQQPATLTYDDFRGRVGR